MVSESELPVKRTLLTLPETTSTLLFASSLIMMDRFMSVFSVFLVSRSKAVVMLQLRIVLVELGALSEVFEGSIAAPANAERWVVSTTNTARKNRMSFISGAL
jgi:hypothetical protein